jgi:hypothetical protein
MPAQINDPKGFADQPVNRPPTGFERELQLMRTNPVDWVREQGHEAWKILIGRPNRHSSEEIHDKVHLFSYQVSDVLVAAFPDTTQRQGAIDKILIEANSRKPEAPEHCPPSVYRILLKEIKSQIVRDQRPGGKLA